MKTTLTKIAMGFALCASVLSSAVAADVNVYSARKEALIKPVLDKFSEQTGITVNLVTGKADALITRIKNEGEFSPADVLLTTDVGRLIRAKDMGLTQTVDSNALNQHIPARLRDTDGHWFALTMRARPIMYAPDRVDPATLANLEDLTAAAWKGKVCIRSSSNIYNQSMIAAMVAQVGEEKAQAWANDFVSAFARPPKGGDRDQIKGVAAGVCDLAIANTYYLAGMLTGTDESQREIAEKVKVFWPNQGGRGAHVNISGASLMAKSPNKDNAVKLMEFLIEADSQAWYAETNHEYPVRAGVEWSDVLKGFGDFKAESIPLEKVGEYNADAVKIMDKAGWK